MGEHKFWLSQNVVDPGMNIHKKGKIEKFDMAKFKDSDPLPLPEGFEWITIDPTSSNHLTDLCEFLKNHYIGNEYFRVDMSLEKLKYILMSPNFNKEFFIAIINSKTKKILAAFISHRKRLMIDGKETAVALA